MKSATSRLLLLVLFAAQAVSAMDFMSQSMIIRESDSTESTTLHNFKFDQPAKINPSLNKIRPIIEILTPILAICEETSTIIIPEQSKLVDQKQAQSFKIFLLQHLWYDQYLLGSKGTLTTNDHYPQRKIFADQLRNIEKGVNFLLPRITSNGKNNQSIIFHDPENNLKILQQLSNNDSLNAKTKAILWNFIKRIQKNTPRKTTNNNDKNSSNPLKDITGTNTTAPITKQNNSNNSQPTPPTSINDLNDLDEKILEFKQQEELAHENLTKCIERQAILIDHAKTLESLKTYTKIKRLKNCQWHTYHHDKFKDLLSEYLTTEDETNFLKQFKEILDEDLIQISIYLKLDLFNHTQQPILFDFAQEKEKRLKVNVLTQEIEKLNTEIKTLKSEHKADLSKTKELNQLKIEHLKATEDAARKRLETALETKKLMQTNLDKLNITEKKRLKQTKSAKENTLDNLTSIDTNIEDPKKEIKPLETDTSTINPKDQEPDNEKNLKIKKLTEQRDSFNELLKISNFNQLMNKLKEKHNPLVWQTWNHITFMQIFEDYFKQLKTGIETFKRIKILAHKEIEDINRIIESSANTDVSEATVFNYAYIQKLEEEYNKKKKVTPQKNNINNPKQPHNNNIGIGRWTLENTIGRILNAFVDSISFLWSLIFYK